MIKNDKNILIIDDSALMRRVISDIIETDRRFHVIGVAVNGLAGLSMLHENAGKVDAVLLDINMPVMNGIEFLEEIKKRNIHTAVIVVSAVTTKDAKETILALELGAFDFITKPDGLEELKSNSFSEKLIHCLTAATKLRIAKPQRLVITEQPAFQAEEEEKLPPSIKKRHRGPDRLKDKLVAIACSTGGPKALNTIIPSLPKALNAGVVIVQHMPEGFTKSLAERLNSISQISVKEAEDGELLKKGWVYIARGGMQLRVVKDGQGNHILRLTKEEPRAGLMPCADVLYESLADSNYSEITCVVLTGMGGDGSAGITRLNKDKNIHVIAQDRKTSAIYGMPKMIKATGLVDEVVPLNEVSDAITKNVGVQ